MSKEARVYIIDVGRSMANRHHGRKESDLDLALRFFWSQITDVIATNRKTLQVGVLGLRTNETDNELAVDDPEGYKNINTLLPIDQLLLNHVHYLRDELQVSDTLEGDAISAVVVATQMIEKATQNAAGKKLKYNRKTILVTDALGHMDGDDIDQIAKQLVSQEIELSVIGVGFNDPLMGFKEEDKEPTKAHNETLLQTFVRASNGQITSLANVLQDLEIPTIKAVNSTATFKGALSLGDPDAYPDASISIDIERYPKLMSLKAVSAKQIVTKSDDNANDDGDQVIDVKDEADGQDDTITPSVSNENGKNVALKRSRAYYIDDENAPGGRRDVDSDELNKGYTYGRTAVDVSTDEAAQLNLATIPGMQILGFIEREKFERYLEMDRAHYIITARADDNLAMALSSLINALKKTHTYAIARLVKKANAAPIMLLLAPWVEDGFECLIDAELPFAEDCRTFRFPPLDRVLTVSGKKIEQHRNLPSDGLKEAMSAYVDAMDLSNFGKDSNGKPCEYARMQDVYSPLPNKINQAVRHRAVNPDGSLPEFLSILTKYQSPPSKLAEQAAPALARLVKEADVKKVPPKQKGRKRDREGEKPISGLDIDALLGPAAQRVEKITAANAIPAFKQAIGDSDNETAIKAASEQLGTIIEGYISSTNSETGSQRAIEALRVFREEMVENDLPDIYNVYIRLLKEKILLGSLGADKKEMWWKIRAAKLGLIDSDICEASGVTKEERDTFYKTSIATKVKE